MPDRGSFAGGDQAYLRDVQYRDPTKLAARANLHARYRTAVRPWFPWVVGQISWPTDAEVLEVGCGAGWLWEEAARHLPAGLRLTLTDLSPGMVDAAVAGATATGHYRAVTGGVEDAQALPFADASFDVTIANHMLYHVPDPARAVAELARVLRPGGALIAAANGPGHLAELHDIEVEVFGDGTPGAARETVEAFGLETGLPIVCRSFGRVERRDHPDVLHCTEPADVVAFLTSHPPGETATPEQRRRLDAVVRDRMAAGGGTLIVHKETGVLIGREPHRHPNVGSSTDVCDDTATGECPGRQS